MSEPLVLDDVEKCVDEIIARVGKRLVVGMPLGLGKPPQLINAIFQRACKDSSIQLKILSALSLEKPAGSSKLESAFLDPFVARVFGDCPDLDYMKAVRRQNLPDNIEVCEFFFKPGAFMNNAYAQQHYISSNYTHAARDVFAQGCNVAMQACAKKVIDGRTVYSMSCNPDTGPELIELMKEREAETGEKFLVIMQVNEKLPFMYNDAIVPDDMVDIVVDHPKYNTTLFSTPKMSVATPDYMIGLNASAMIRDGGTLQIGIGALGDAIVYAAKMRNEHNEHYREILQQAGIVQDAGDLINRIGGTGIFEKGLYGATEMFVDGFMHLFNAGILKRRVYDFTELQRLLNRGEVSDEEPLRPNLFDQLEKEGERVIRTHEFEVLQHHGVFRDDCRYELGHIIAPDGERIMANLAIPETRMKLAEKCLGERLRNGIVLHGGFFLGPQAFYDMLNDLPEEEVRRICMSTVYNINQLDNDPPLYKAQRKDARFINTGIMPSLFGAVASDALADNRIISGVGGQFNFVDMAHHLKDGRSILMCRAVRDKEGAGASSNVVYNYGHCTVPRHLRDIIITEYGVAELRSRTDAECAKAMLNITDSRFQEGLLAKAKAAGKVEAGHQIPERFRNNTPEKLERILEPYRKQGHFPPFPLGCDFTDDELLLGKALKGVKAAATSTPKWRLALDAFFFKDVPAGAKPYLERLQIGDPQSMQDKVVRMLLVRELQAAGAC